MTLMLIVMSVMWAGLQVAQKGSDIGQKQAYFEQNIAGPMQAFDKLLDPEHQPRHRRPERVRPELHDRSEQRRPERAARDRRRRRRQADRDGLPDQSEQPEPEHLDASGRSGGPNQNHNVAGSVPMFTFMSANGTVLPISSPASVATSSTQVAVTISSGVERAHLPRHAAHLVPEPLGRRAIMRRLIGNDEGFVLFVVLGAIAVITAVAFGGFFLAQQSVADSRRVQTESKAFQVAASGLDRELATFSTTNFNGNAELHQDGHDAGRPVHHLRGDDRRSVHVHHRFARPSRRTPARRSARPSSTWTCGT